MNHHQPVASVMSQEPLTAHKAMKFSEVRALFLENKIHHLPVVDGQKLIGIISYSDILRISYGEAFGMDRRGEDAYLDDQVTINQIMTEEPVTVSPQETIRDAARKLSSGDFHALPVVDAGNLKGILTTTDLTRYLVEILG